MVQAFMEDAAGSAERECDAAEDADALAFKSIESFNILCVGESGLGKSTFLRDIFAHLDPTKFHEARRRVAAQRDVVHALEDAIRRNEQESRQCDDTRALQLREERVALKARRDEARAALDELRQQKRQQEQTVAQLRTEIAELEHLLCELRRRRDAEEDDEAATRIGHETTEVSCRLIKEMPLFEGSRHGLDVTLIDTPGYGDVLVDSPANSSAAKVVAEVKRRIEAHVHKDRATRPGLPLDDEKKYWNELVHLCLFFVPPHRMKRADVELMTRLHELVPLVVVIAKADTMTKSETREFKAEVRQQLQSE
ncbi:cbn-unc-59 protein, partial [Chrysochromulina tobinii]